MWLCEWKKSVGLLVRTRVLNRCALLRTRHYYKGLQKGNDIVGLSLVRVSLIFMYRMNCITPHSSGWFVSYFDAPIQNRSILKYCIGSYCNALWVRILWWYCDSNAEHGRIYIFRRQQLFNKSWNNVDLSVFLDHICVFFVLKQDINDRYPPTSLP